MSETIHALCPECGRAIGEIDEEYDIWTCHNCGGSWLLGDVLA